MGDSAGYDPGVIEVQFATLEGGVTALNTQAGRLISQIGDVERAAGSLANSWTGTGHHSYTSPKTQWTTAAGRLHDDILALKTAVADAKGHYEENENAVTRLFEV
jgi:WXG100 family type VII secretion target